MGTAPGSLVHAMYNDDIARMLIGVYSSTKIVVANMLPPMTLVESTKKENRCTVQLHETPINPHGSNDNHLVDSKDVPTRCGAGRQQYTSFRGMVFVAVDSMQWQVSLGLALLSVSAVVVVHRPTRYLSTMLQYETMGDFTRINGWQRDVM
mmetsp:Transcript_18764/g.53487  ORF Transcript_18764/g.53487 Transcript_18764/m.53487 type:complete len:151 (-) Transcript_18764:195-647(-)